jgi:D-tyrosyl-tRNA(Tyr) deacylase
MRAVIQRVSSADVRVDGAIVGQIGNGLLLLLGIEAADTTEDIEWLCGKICRMRIFEDADGVMNLSLLDCGGDAIVISQFTLFASIKKGNRPSYIAAARPEIAEPLYEQFKHRLSSEFNRPVQCGIFGAMMDVALVNSGPVTILLDSKDRQ